MKRYWKMILSQRQFETLLGLIMILFCLNGVAIQTFAQVDANTLLLLRSENSLNGEQGETPTQASGFSFQPGIQGQGALLGNPNQVFYQSANNINALEGTIEFWIKPNWNGNDGLDHYLIRWGVGGGLLLGKDGANNLRIILNRFGAFPGGEKGVAVNIDSWTANQWHHVAFTFSNTQKKNRVFVDGTQRAEDFFTGDLPPVSDSTFQMGGDGAGGYTQAVIDELRISSVARTPQEIEARFAAALTATSISLSLPTQNLYETWKITPQITAVTNVGTVNIPASAINWSSSNPNIATTNAAGQIIGVQAGSATLTANFNGAQATTTVSVRAPVLPPRVNVISNYLATPAANSLYEIPVVILRYLPTADGIKIDPAWVPDFFSLNTQIPLAPLESSLNSYDEILKFQLEEGSRFRGYGSQMPPPSLGYRVVASITVYEPTPPGKLLTTGVGDPVYHPEMFQIFERFGLQNYVNNMGVKEIWTSTGGVDRSFPSYNPAIHPPENFRAGWESNMSSPTTGDISNSNRDNSDQPVYNRTYVTYGRNITRLDPVTIHGDGHQLESILAEISRRQTGDTNFFWQNFVGRATNGAWQRGRAGDTHHPPNVLNDYDYQNLTPFSSDIMDWKPDGSGQQTLFSAATYRDIPYGFPNNFLPSPHYEEHWHIFWRQSMPGYGNTIPYNTSRMTNWWQYTGDWDRAIRSGVGLYEPANCSYTLSANSLDVVSSGGTGSVAVTTGNGCKWFASNNANWTPLTSGDTGNGTGTVNFTIAPNPNGNSRTTKIIIAGQIFTVTQFAAPTAASVTVGGRIMTADGRGISKATVILTDFSGLSRSVRTNPFGYYRFDDVQAGGSYIFNVKHKVHTFAPQVVTVTDDISDLNFVANKLLKFK